MKHIFTISLCFLALSLSAQETITYPYNPDGDADGLIAVPDIQDLLAVYGSPFSPAEIMVGDTALSEWIQILYQALQDQQELIDPCEDENSVNYYGYDYNIVPIGNQCWFAENLNSEQYSNGENINESTPTNIDGLLALYVENLEQLEGQSAVFYSALVTMGDRNVCPSGYHVPSWSDWTELASFLGPSNAGYLLKNDQPWGGSNEYGFSAKPLGILSHNVNYDESVNYQYCNWGIEYFCSGENTPPSCHHLFEGIIQGLEQANYNLVNADMNIDSYINDFESFETSIDSLYVNTINQMVYNYLEGQDHFFLTETLDLIAQVIFGVSDYNELLSFLVAEIIDQFDVLQFDNNGETINEVVLWELIEEVKLFYEELYNLNQDLLEQSCADLEEDFIATNCLDLDALYFDYCGPAPVPYFESSTLLDQGLISSYHVAVDEELISHLVDIEVADTDILMPSIPNAIINWQFGDLVVLYGLNSVDATSGHHMSLSRTMELEIYSLNSTDFSSIRCIKD